MDRERVEIGQTVVAQGDRIVAMGKSGEVPIPTVATVIDGTGHFLLPGLTDSHVHLEAWDRFRPDFGDAALSRERRHDCDEHARDADLLEWKRRMQAGELAGSTIYTAGEFVIGPEGPTLFGESSADSEDDIAALARAVG